MWYAPILVHVLLIAIARRVWRRRGLEWSPFETAECVVMPFVLFLAWPFVASLIPLPWKELETMNKAVHLTTPYLPPLLIFWSWFFWSGLKRKPGS